MVYQGNKMEELLPYLGEPGKPARVIYKGQLATASCDTQDANCSTNWPLPTLLAH